MRARNVSEERNRLKTEIEKGRRQSSLTYKIDTLCKRAMDFAAYTTAQS